MGRRARTFAFDVFLVTTNLLLRFPGHRLRIGVLRHLVRASVGDGVNVERNVRIRGRGGIVIGDRCNINRGVLLDGGGGLTIGSMVNISPEVLLITTEHDPDSPGFGARNRPVVIHDRAWIATRAIVLPGATVREGVIVGAGSVVHGETPPWTIVAGNPARPVRERSKEAQADLMPYRRWLH